MGEPRRIGAATLELQQVLGVGPPLALLADPVGDRDAHVLEEDLVDLLLAVDRPVERGDRPDGYAGGLHVQQEEGYPPLRAILAGGAHQAEHPVGEMTERIPGLLPIDHEVIALAHRAGAQ